MSGQIKTLLLSVKITLSKQAQLELKMEKRMLIQIKRKLKWLYFGAKEGCFIMIRVLI